MDKVIPVVVINNISDTEKVLSSLRSGGINTAEITFRTQCAKEAIALGVKLFPDMNIGAGTVINAEQCTDALTSGAKFIVSPGFSLEVADICKKNNVDYFPGCVTPTEIMNAISYGLNVLKFFPANVYGGLQALKALSAPFPQVKFIPTGGVDLSNLKEFLSFEKTYAVGGSFMMKGDIVTNCKKINEIVSGVYKQ